MLHTPSPARSTQRCESGGEKHNNAVQNIMLSIIGCVIPPPKTPWPRLRVRATSDRHLAGYCSRKSGDRLRVQKNSRKFMSLAFPPPLPCPLADSSSSSSTTISTAMRDVCTTNIVSTTGVRRVRLATLGLVALRSLLSLSVCQLLALIALARFVGKSARDL